MLASLSSAALCRKKGSAAVVASTAALAAPTAFSAFLPSLHLHLPFPPPPRLFGDCSFNFSFSLLRSLLFDTSWLPPPPPPPPSEKQAQTHTQRNKGKKSTGTYPAAANPEIADEEGGWLLPQGKALPPLPPRLLLRERKGEREKGPKWRKAGLLRLAFGVQGART